jgi:ribose transport system ATP-binding protein
VPEERKTEGLVLPLSVAGNTTLARLAEVAAGGWLLPAAERSAFAREQERLGIRAAGPEQGTWQLSGGNQQKIVLAKWLRTEPSVLLLDEPTRGVDIGAKAELYRIVTDLAAEGMAVVLASSDLVEVLGLAHRVLVFRGGSPVGELAPPDLDEERIMALAVGANGAAA